MPEYYSDEWWESENRRLERIRGEGENRAYKEMEPKLNELSSLRSAMRQIGRKLNCGKETYTWGVFGPSPDYKVTLEAINKLKEGR
jgi:hypothetical protein